MKPASGSDEVADPSADHAGRGTALRRCWANPRLRRALISYLLFNIAEWASWIALLVWAYDRDGVRGSSVMALVQLVPAAAFAPAVATRLARLPGPRALRLGYAAQCVAGLVLGTAILLDVPFAVACVLAALGSCAVTCTRPVYNTLLPEVSETTAELTAGNATSGSAEAAATFLGPLACGVLIALWGPGEWCSSWLPEAWCRCSWCLASAPAWPGCRPRPRTVLRRSCEQYCGTRPRGSS